MNDDYVIRRREYISEVRKSFDQTNEEMGEQTATKVSSSFLMQKIRCVLALGLVLGFLIFSYSKSEIMGYQAKDVIDIISDNQYYTNLQEYVKITLYQ